MLFVSIDATSDTSSANITVNPDGTFQKTTKNGVISGGISDQTAYLKTSNQSGQVDVSISKDNGLAIHWANKDSSENKNDSQLTESSINISPGKLLFVASDGKEFAFAKEQGMMLTDSKTNTIIKILPDGQITKTVQGNEVAITADKK